MSAYIKTLTQGADEIAPRTKTSAITNDSNVSLDTLLSNKQDADATILKQANVVNNTTSTSTVYPLSANQGKLLNDRLDNIANIGRFLSIWNATTGLPTSNPSTSPYTYHTGDYYRVANVANTATDNLIPNGSSYTSGVASTTHFVPTTAEPTLQIGDVYYYDGTNWILEASGGHGTVQDVQVNSTSVVSGGIADIELSDFGITSTVTELNYTDGVTSNIQTQLDNKQASLPSGTNDRFLHTNSSTGALEWASVPTPTAYILGGEE